MYVFVNLYVYVYAYVYVFAYNGFGVEVGDHDLAFWLSVFFVGFGAGTPYSEPQKVGTWV